MMLLTETEHARTVEGGFLVLKGLLNDEHLAKRVLTKAGVYGILTE
tara:strand:- start:3940 stop:4077 length:138 start_codon:yes stop_codon:yes gene_type:complete